MTLLINIDTADHMDPTVSSRLLFSLKGISIKKSYIGKLQPTISTTFAKNMGLLQTNFVVRGVIDIPDHKIGEFKAEFLGEFESIFKPIH
jgi:hypothetical protein